MKITKYRTIAEVYPYLSLEAEIVLNNNDKVYTNITVNNHNEQEEYCEDSTWTYKMPLTEVDWENVDDCYYDVETKEHDEIIYALLDLWNRNPVFENNPEWKNYETQEIEL